MKDGSTFILILKKMLGDDTVNINDIIANNQQKTTLKLNNR